MLLRKPWDHGIDLKEDFPQKKGQLIPLSVDEQKEVEAFLDNQLSKGYIRPSNSQQTSLVFFVSKKDGKKHMVQDYQYLNEWTVKNNYPLPLISQLVDKLKGCKLFMRMDLWWGYNNVRIHKGDEWKAAFTMHKGSFKPLVMYFGLCNSPATFQKMMNEIFHDMSDVCIVYINDLMIFMEKDNQEELFNFGDKEKASFETLKAAFTTAPMLQYPDQGRKFRLETDTSEFAIGEVISVKCDDGKFRPVAYMSHSMTPPEQNYPIHDKVMLAIIKATEA